MGLFSDSLKNPEHPVVVSDAVVAALESALREPPILHAYRNGGRGGGAGPSIVLVFAGGGCAVAKFEDQVANGTMMIRQERAAWLVACRAGLGHLVAVTVLRELESQQTPGAHALASVQSVWPNCEAVPLSIPLDQVDPHDVLCAATFDYVVHATDRRGNNWVTLTGTQPGQLKLIDHGHAWGDGVSSDLYDRVKSQGPVPIPDHVKESCEQWLGTWPGEELAELLEPPKLDAMHIRVTSLVDSGVLP